ncbi:MAG: P-loop NTPase [Deltaproteobacteria bacterium]|jgi:MinD superfamily P-loop ATPase|nr:P-loop NTPase [Deltaproteobacteria bacterium]MBT4268209.1 P-loop NTPase [Deltaproteobacteria bacterium]MBT4640162.1 P-loop NTPase [Deltaproteobacteria bacterium]MBT6500697.1 P-loop NTPase [Deltaproteobacteria bacterium]MBT7151793.1 P-loop NTPase [Deltaproteobacteria bacterium]
MIISVASGKGGTGKTTIATNLAYSLGSKARILDCDVEEPNSHLFLSPEIFESNPAHMLVPEVDEQKCDFCKKCAEICRFNGITFIGNTVLTFPQLCHSCGGCFEVCPQNAISESKRELGMIEEGLSNDLDFISGRLRVGEAMSPPLIKKVRDHVQPGKINIIDAPPGTSCPVISAMKWVDFVLMVTEPTPFGLHDLKLAVEAVKILDIPHGLVINRANIGNNGVSQYAEQEKIPILMEIPFDREIAEMYSRGKLIVEEKPAWKEKFIALFQEIKKTTQSDLLESESVL